MKMKVLKTSVIGAAFIIGPLSAYAGGQLDTFDLTTLEDQNGDGLFEIPIVGIFWDERCAAVSYTLDDTPANNGTPNELPVATVQAEVQAAFDQWNNIRSSYINMQVDQIAPVAPISLFDFTNALTFEHAEPTSGFIARSPSVSLQQDATFTPGLDIDGDGDSDVFDPEVVGVNRCMDVDSDGDIEFPAGDYKAGTILDNDVEFNAGAITFVSEPDTLGNSADIQAVAAHEFGHSHGLAHSALDDTTDDNPNGATMFPFIDISSVDFQLETRELSLDDIAWSAYVYPEGSGVDLGALQYGDLDFNWVFKTITGEITSGPQGGAPVAGAHVIARGLGSNFRVVGAYSGNTTLGLDLFSGGLFVNPQELGVQNGDYVIPVPAGLYNVQLEALDGTPVAAGRVNTNNIVGDIYGLLDFEEEFYNVRESAFENDPGDRFPILVNPIHGADNINLVTNVTTELGQGIAAVDTVFPSSAFVAGDLLLKRIPGADVSAILNGSGSLHSATFGVLNLDSDLTTQFPSAALYLGEVDDLGNVTLDTKPLRKVSPFNAQEFDDSPLYFKAERALSRRLLKKLNKNPNLDVFLALEIGEGPFLGTGLGPTVAGTTIVTGDSFLRRVLVNSNDGSETEIIAPLSIDLLFQLSLTE